MQKVRPMQLDNINLNDFKSYYWLKSELVAFCKKYKLPTTGLKSELQKRIEIYIATGNKSPILKSNKNKNRDSNAEITPDTKVVNYHNDARTRDFFIKHIGPHFRFNDYLRQFRARPSGVSHLTYGDLIQGWLLAEENKRKLGKESKIGDQFEYNQFIRDFFVNEKNKTLQDAIAAWSFIKSYSGERTYKHYVLLKKQNNKL